jgi:amino acid transporter
VLGVTAINYLNVKMSGAIQVLLRSLKMGATLLIVVGGILCGAKRANEPAPTMAPLGLGTIAPC